MTDLVALPKPRFTSWETASIGRQIVSAMAGSSQGDVADWIISLWQRLVQITIDTQEEKLEATAHLRGTS